jgi:acyl phosphate:glycerol-3-phosphate acyltransferase
MGSSLLGVWVVTVVIFRYSSLGAIAAAAATPLVFLVFGDGNAYFYAATVMAGFLIWRHRGNLRRLMAGEETRIGQKATANQS